MGWPEHWRAILDDLGPASQRRRTRGREYARSGRVASLHARPGELTGKVHGSRTTPHAVTIGVPVFTADQWRAVLDGLLAQARHGARLLAGQPPIGLEDELRAVGIALFPPRSSLRLRCSCADARMPCSHVAAVWEQAAGALADDPFLLFRLRGRGRERLLAELAAARRPPATDSPDRVAAASLSADGWGRARLPLDNLRLPPARSPIMPAATLRVAGDPPGWVGGVTAWDLLRAHVERAADFAATL